MVDLYVETGDKALLRSAVRQWESTTHCKTYLTGAVGSRFIGEAFGDSHELPPDLVYGETRATIGNIMLSWRLASRDMPTPSSVACATSSLRQRRSCARRHAWSAGDVPVLTLPVEPRLTVLHPAADALRGRVAIERGPVVYALESPD